MHYHAENEHRNLAPGAGKYRFTVAAATAIYLQLARIPAE
jgi:hypothetical protein